CSRAFILSKIEIKTFLRSIPVLHRKVFILLFSPILQQRHRRIMPRRAHHAAAGMRAGAAEIESLDGRAIAGALWGWSQREKLVRGDLALKDIAVGQAIALLDIERAEHLAVED